jgi:FkbM family methyltransferase
LERFVITQKMQYQVERWRLVDRVLRRALIRRMVRRALSEAPSLSISFSSHKDSIGIEVLCSGTFEREILLFSEAILEDHINSENIGSRPKVAIDIGANIGTHSLFFSTLVDKVFAFEPNPAVALVCRANQVAAARPNVEVFDLALSDHSGTATLFVPDFGGGTLEILSDKDLPISVRVERGDDFIEPRLKGDERVVLVKADVEGHEPKVFSGILDILRKHRPVIFFESSSSAHLLCCKRILESVGYTRFDVVQKDWEDGRFGKFLSLISGKTGISLKPINLTNDRFYSAVVARPSATTP